MARINFPLVRVSVLLVLNPNEPFNTAVRKGTAGDTLNRIMETISPEAVYFTEQNGERSAIMIAEVNKPSEIPALAEPWFLQFNANCEFHVVMSPDDLHKAGLEGLGKKWA